MELIGVLYMSKRIRAFRPKLQRKPYLNSYMSAYLVNLKGPLLKIRMIENKSHFAFLIAVPIVLRFTFEYLSLKGSDVLYCTIEKKSFEYMKP